MQKTKLMKNISKDLSKRMLGNVRSNVFGKVNRDPKLKFTLFGRRKASSLSVKMDRIANSIPKSALLLVALGSGIGIAALASHGAIQQTDTSAGVSYSDTTNMYGIKVARQGSVAHTAQGYSRELRQKIGSAYGYFAGSLGLTAVSAYYLSHSSLAYRIHQNTWLFLGVGVVGTLAAMYGTMAIPYQNTIPKHLAWGTFAALEGLCLAPLTVLGGPLLVNAAIGTGCIVGAVSLLTAVAPSDAWREWSGVFGIGLGLLMGASIGLMFFPQSNMLYNFWLYGGLALHGWGVFRGNGRIIDHANTIPIERFDPINESISLYIHTLGIFIRMVMMLQNGNRKK